MYQGPGEVLSVIGGGRYVAQRQVLLVRSLGLVRHGAYELIHTQSERPDQTYSADVGKKRRGQARAQSVIVVIPIDILWWSRMH
jgi:hypothetical protein